MRPEDQDARLREQVETALVKYRMGVEYGFDVAWQAAGMQTPAGVQTVVVYQVLLTRRSPLLGQGPLYHIAQIPSPQPTFEQVDGAVKDGVQQLAALYEQVRAVPPQAEPRVPLALANGRHP